MTSEGRDNSTDCVTRVQESLLTSPSRLVAGGRLGPPTDSLFSGRNRAALTRSSLERIVGFCEDRGRDPLRVRLRWAS